MKFAIFMMIWLFSALVCCAEEKPPYRLLFGNDTTHITSCPSPFNMRPGSFKEEHIRAVVQESAVQGVDAHLLQPGMGWVPWWQSEVYPMSHHVQWLTEHGMKPNSYENFVLKGGDLVAAYVDECRKVGMASLISFRLNDAHFLSHAEQDYDSEQEIQNARDSVCRFYGEHPEFVIGDSAEDHYRYLQDWSHDEVRDYKFRLIEELCVKYNIDGLELDFMRYPAYFNLKETTELDRVEIMTGFIGRIRAVMDRLEAEDGRKRWLGIRVTAYPQMWSEIGVDLEKFSDAGLNWVNCSSHYFTDLQMEISGIRSMVPNHVALYSELHYVTAVGPYLKVETDTGRKSIGSVRRRTDPLQFYTAAHLAYEQGADGVSLFNFHYYRGSRGVYTREGKKEPPFDILPYLIDPDWLARQPQWYFLGRSFNPLMPNNPFRKSFNPGKPQTLQLLMSQPTGGWTSDARLRIEGREPLGDSVWAITFNGKNLELTEDVSEPYPVRFPTGILEPDYYRAFVLPKSLLKDGMNEISVTMLSGQKTQLFYLDIAVK